MMLVRNGDGLRPGAKKGAAHAQLRTDRVKANDAGSREWA